MDPRDRKPCYDPGVAEDPASAATENRVALLSCKRKHTNVVKSFDGVVAEFGSSADIVRKGTQ